jgi:hypothetical protein
MEYLQLSKVYVNNIHNKAGTQAMGIDGSGRITTPARPVFHAKKSTNGNTTYAAGSVISADMTSVESNVGGHYKTSGGDVGKFVAPVAGFYHFQMNLFNNSTTAKRVALVRSGDNVNFAGQGQRGQYNDFNVSGLTYLDVGELVYVYNQYADTVIYHGPNHSYWSGYFIG